MLERFKHPKPKRISLEKLVKKYPPHYTAEQIAEEELRKPQDQEELATRLNEYFENIAEKNTKRKEKKYIAAIKAMEDLKKEKKREEKRKQKEKEKEFLERAKGKMLDDEQILLLSEETAQRYPDKADNFSWRITVAADTLAINYFEIFRTKYTKKQKETLKNKLIKYREDTLKEKERRIRAQSARDPSGPQKKDDDDK